MGITIIGIFKKYEISYIFILILLKYTAITLKKRIDSSLFEVSQCIFVQIKHSHFMR